MFLSIKRFLRSKYADLITDDDKENLLYLTKVFPFKVSKYVLDELIDWKDYKKDPIYRLVFPHQGMLSQDQMKQLRTVSDLTEERGVINSIRQGLNPHPNGQKANIPIMGSREFGGLQHKYPETVLFFPAEGQTCHSFCTYCFRWAQFVNINDHTFRSKDQKDLFDYLRYHKEVTDVLVTGGDPLFMKNETLANYLNILLNPELSHIRSIRLGSKSLSFYPEGFIGKDGDAFFKMTKHLQSAGKNIVFMAHFSHIKELQTNKVEMAIERFRNAGIPIRSQAPLVKGINDSSAIWQQMWQRQVELGVIPYYMFIERNTGPFDHFAVPLSRAYQIFTDAYSNMSGLAKTVRGPSMSADPGKILIDGIITLAKEKYFVLKFIQARDTSRINQTFLAKYSDKAKWIDDLEICESIPYHNIQSKFIHNN